MAIIASFMGIAVVVPTAVLVGTASLRQGDFEDKIRSTYVAESAVLAVIADLQRGADGDPTSLADYIPPTVNFDNTVPFVTVREVGADAGSGPGSGRLATRRSVTYEAGGPPNVVTGASPQGALTELADNDAQFYRLTAVGDLPTPTVGHTPDPGWENNPQRVVYEVTSQPLGFTAVDMAQVRLNVQAWSESVRFQAFVYNPDLPNATLDGYNPNPYLNRLLDHDHLSNVALHYHDALHDHHNDKTGDPLHDHHPMADHHHHVEGGITGHPADVPEHDHHHHEFAHDHYHGHDHGRDDVTDDQHADHDDATHDDPDDAHHHHEGDHLHLMDSGDPHSHDHERHTHHPNNQHHGEEVVSFFLDRDDLDYLNSLETKVLRIKVVATVYFDPDHHHVVHGSTSEGKRGGNNWVHGHTHHWLFKPRRDMQLWTDFIDFDISGMATVDQVGISGEPNIIKGTRVSGAAADTVGDDLSYYTVGPPPSVIEFEVESQDFTLDRVDTVSVNLVVRKEPSLEGDDDETEVGLFIYNPTDRGHPVNGYDSQPDKEFLVEPASVDRVLEFHLGKADLAYLNTLSPPSVKVKVRVKARGNNDPFEFRVDQVRFIATTTDPQEEAVRPATMQYIDPGLRDPALAVVEPGKGYLVQLEGVKPGMMNVSWAFQQPLPSYRHLDDRDNDAIPGHDADDWAGIFVFRGPVVDEDDDVVRVLAPGGITGLPEIPDDDDLHEDDDDEDDGNVVVARAHVHHGASFVRTGFFEVESGVYTVVYLNNFDDEDGVKILTSPFTPNGEDAGIWVYVSAFKDYAIQADSGKVSMKAVVRQIPGPARSPFGPWATDNIAWSKNQVLIQSWGEPTDVARVVLDSDADGILDEVDGAFIDGRFLDHSNGVSAHFTDQHRGGVTYGSMVDTAGLTINVRDLNDPAAGVLIWATGQGEAVASVSACGSTFLLTIGDVVKATCGSLKVEVVHGPVEVPLTVYFAATLPQGAVAEVTQVSPNSFRIENLQESGAVITVASDSASVQLEPGALVQVIGGSPLPTPAPTPTPTLTPTPAPTATPTRLPTATPRRGPIPTDTPLPTPTPEPTETPTPGPTPTPAPTATPTPTPAPTATPTPVAIASENWESGGFSGGSGWLSAWTAQGGNDAVVTSQNTPYAGSYHLRLQSSDGYVQRAVDLSGRSGVRLTFYAKVESFEGSDSALARVSPDGTNWTTVKTWTSADSDGVYRLVDIDLSGFSMTAQFYIAFEGNMNAVGDRLLIDNVDVR